MITIAVECVESARDRLQGTVEQRPVPGSVDGQHLRLDPQGDHDATGGRVHPDVVALTPAASETIDTMVSGITGGSADFTFGAGNFGPNNIFGLRRVESKTLAAPVVWDSANHGRFYMADVSLARFEESAGRTNTSLVRLETHAAYGTERAAAAVRIAAS